MVSAAAADYANASVMKMNRWRYFAEWTAAVAAAEAELGASSEKNRKNR